MDLAFFLQKIVDKIIKNPFKRIILLNIYPVIPNNIIIEALDNVGIKITSYTPKG